MKKIISQFDKLTPEQLYKILKLRQDVFIIEQNCIYSDLDGYDSKAIHMLFLDKNELAAYSRIFSPDIKYKNESSIGRIIVAKDYRKRTLGKELIRESISYCITNFSNRTIRIEAQAALEDYYSKLGFVSDSKIYSVDDIDHIQMIYATNSL